MQRSDRTVLPWTMAKETAHVRHAKAPSGRQKRAAYGPAASMDCTEASPPQILPFCVLLAPHALPEPCSQEKDLGVLVKSKLPLHEPQEHPAVASPTLKHYQRVECRAQRLALRSSSVGQLSFCVLFASISRYVHA